MGDILAAAACIAALGASFAVMAKMRWRHTCRIYMRSEDIDLQVGTEQNVSINGGPFPGNMLLRDVRADRSDNAQWDVTARWSTGYVATCTPEGIEER